MISIPGFKDDSSSMVPYARMLHAAGFNVLLYDSRGTGGSGGTFTLGLREVHDVEGAARFLDGRTGLPNHHYGLLGVSMGAGVAIVAASHLPEVRAVVADSPYTNQHITVDRLDSLRLGPLSLPQAPDAPWLVDRVQPGETRGRRAKVARHPGQRDRRGSGLVPINGIRL